MSVQQLEAQFRNKLNISLSKDAPIDQTKDKKKKKRNKKRKPRGEDRYFGRFSCKLCKKMWESSHVYTIAGTMTVKYKQRCKRCPGEEAWTFPYDLQMITCSICGVSSDMCRCECEDCGKLWYRPRGKDKLIDTSLYCNCRKKKKNELGTKIDMKKPHEKDLCQRCKTGRSCWGAPPSDIEDYYSD